MAKHTMDAKHVLREIRLMRHMGRHDNIISLEDLIIRENADDRRVSLASLALPQPAWRLGLWP